MRSDVEITKKLNDAVEFFDRCSEGSEQRLRAAIVVRTLAWASGESNVCPLLKCTDGESVVPIKS